MHRGAGVSSKDAAQLVSREELPAFWNTLTQAEKDFYLSKNLPKRIFWRRHTPEDES